MVNLKERLLGSWLGDRLLTDGRVIELEDAGSDVRRIVVETASAGSASGQPGDKVQVYLPGTGARTYTPFAFHESGRRFELLAYLHGGGPGSAWARTLRTGDAVRFLEARKSLSLASFESPVALFGDETSYALARSLLEIKGPLSDHVMVTLEVGDLASARAVSRRFGIPESALLQRQSGRAHLAGIAEWLVGWSGAAGSIVLTGCAQSIQHLRVDLRAMSPAPRHRTKAYWSTGKAGLD